MRSFQSTLRPQDLEDLKRREEEGMAVFEAWKKAKDAELNEQARKVGLTPSNSMLRRGALAPVVRRFADRLAKRVVGAAASSTAPSRVSCHFRQLAQLPFVCAPPLPNAASP